MWLYMTLCSGPMARPTTGKQHPPRGVLGKKRVVGWGAHRCWTDAMRTSENPVNAKFAELTFRNCLENRNGSLIRPPKASRSARRGADRPALGANNACSRSLGLFPKQFRKGYSPKFIYPLR